MPIHLAPISRRQFLVRSATAAVSIAALPELLAKEKNADENFWALFSDIHLAADRTKVARGINMTEHFVQVSKELLAQPKRPRGLIVAGDCAYNSGETDDYKLLADLLQPVREGGVPVHLALGNHDHRERFWNALEQEKSAKRPLVDRQVALMPTARANWFILDSLEKTLSTPGLLGPEQLRWLGETLDANAGKPAIVLVHHNPGTAENITGLKDTDAFFEVIRPRNQVKAFIYGHTHKWSIERDSSGIHLVNLPPVAYIFKEGDPAGWVQAHLDAKAMRLELRCIDSKHPQHGRTAELAWR